MKKQILLDNLEQLETREYTKLTPMLVPETWEDLKELCEDIKGIEFASGNAKGEIIQLDNIWFAENGDIWGYSENWEEVCVIGKNRTPQQMWQIIKSLIGE